MSKNKNKGEIFCLMGKSASGKDTVYKELLKVAHIKPVVSYTTRPMRDGEVDGKEYFFITEKQLIEMQDKLIEKRDYYTTKGHWVYATVDDGQFDKSSDMLLITAPDQFKAIQKYFGKDRVKQIYVTIDDGVRLQRSLCREMAQTNPNYSEMCRRFLADEQDFKNVDKTMSFENDDLYKCIANIISKTNIKLKKQCTVN